RRGDETIGSLHHRKLADHHMGLPGGIGQRPAPANFDVALVAVLIAPRPDTAFAGEAADDGWEPHRIDDERVGIHAYGQRTVHQAYALVDMYHPQIGTIQTPTGQPLAALAHKAQPARQFAPDLGGVADEGGYPLELVDRYVRIDLDALVSRQFRD